MQNLRVFLSESSILYAQCRSFSRFILRNAGVLCISAKYLSFGYVTGIEKKKISRCEFEWAPGGERERKREIERCTKNKE